MRWVVPMAAWIAVYESFVERDWWLCRRMGIGEDQ